MRLLHEQHQIVIPAHTSVRNTFLTETMTDCRASYPFIIRAHRGIHQVRPGLGQQLLHQRPGQPQPTMRRMHHDPAHLQRIRRRKNHRPRLLKDLRPVILRRPLQRGDAHQQTRGIAEEQSGAPRRGCARATPPPKPGHRSARAPRMPPAPRHCTPQES